MANNFFETNNNILISSSLKDQLNLEDISDENPLKKGLELRKDTNLKFITNTTGLIEFNVIKLKIEQNLLKIKVINKNVNALDFLEKKDQNFAFYLKQGLKEKLFELKLKELKLNEKFLNFVFEYDT